MPAGSPPISDASLRPIKAVEHVSGMIDVIFRWNASLPRTLAAIAERARRTALTGAVAAFAWVQMLSPLLHTHVTVSVASLESGIHLPVALLHGGHGHDIPGLSHGLFQDEANAITAPPEHRRNDASPPIGATMPAPGDPQLRLSTRVPDQNAATSDPLVRSHHRLHPPAQAPPVTA